MLRPLTSAKPRRRGHSRGGGYRRASMGGSVRRRRAPVDRGQSGGARRILSRNVTQWIQNCPPPLSWDCERLQLTTRWAVGCFMPRFYALRERHGFDYRGIVNDLLLQETPHCRMLPSTSAERELQRRVSLAVAILLNREGASVPIPSMPPIPRPVRATPVRQPWLRALLTGWI